jgi:hypothetical protein
MRERKEKRPCPAKICDYVFTIDDMQCVAGSVGDCNRPHFASAGKSQFHTKDLREATVAINNILDKLENSDESRCLAILNTPEGFLLAWVRHDAVSSHSDPDEIRAALKLVSRNRSRSRRH